MRTMKLLAAITVAVTIAGSTCAAAQGAEPVDETYSALAAVSEEATSGTTDVLGGLAPVQPNDSGPGAVNATVGDVDVVLPRDPSDPVSLDDGDVDIALGLPFADEASDANPLAQGLVSYDNNNGSTTAIGVKSDGSVQMTTTIDSSSAPSQYAYELEVPDGATLSSTSDGGVVISDASGGYLAGVAPAWAVDSHGEQFQLATR